jgi:hypothetical protein
MRKGDVGSNTAVFWDISNGGKMKDVVFCDMALFGSDKRSQSFGGTSPPSSE